MRAQLHVHAAQSRQPERAAKLIATDLLRSFPRQRGVTLAIWAQAPHPGLTPTPWVLDGLLSALIEAERTPVTLLPLGDRDTCEALLRKAGRGGPIPGHELVERPSRDRTLSLRVPGRDKPVTLARELVGTSLILCAPLGFAAREQGTVRRWWGPLSHALIELARAHGWTPPAPKLRTTLRGFVDDGAATAIAIGHELLSASFASAALLLDATWAAALEPAPPEPARARGPDGRFIRRATARRDRGPRAPTLLGELAAADRVLGLSDLGRLELDALAGVDEFLIGALGLGSSLELGASPRHARAPEFDRSPGRWPQLCPTPARPEPTRLADRAIAGIRSQSSRLSARGREQPALPARVPGEFASLWTRRWYGEHPLARSLERRASGVELR